MYSVREISGLIGTQAVLRDERGLSVLVTIEDLKQSYGTDRALVVPVSGSGSAWVNLSSLYRDEWGA